MKIGNIDIGTSPALAPMAGVADRAFREICKEYGCGYVVGEMASAKGLLYQSTKTQSLLSVSEKERPMAIQLFGYEPQTMAQAAKFTLKFSPDIIDINMGCPAPKIVNNNSGSALMKNPTLAGEIVKAVVDAVNIPVTVKFRKGWDSSSVNAVEFAKIMEQSGANALCVHGRTREQMYAPSVDLDIITDVKKAVSIPVIANGDVVDVSSYVNTMEKTKCDLVMIGRGCLGAPWVFNQINHYNQTGEILSEPTLEEKMDIMVRHIGLICKYKGERIGMKEARKHAAWYIKNVKGAAKLRKKAGELSTYEDAKNLAKEILCSF